VIEDCLLSGRTTCDALVAGEPRDFKSPAPGTDRQFSYMLSMPRT